MFRDQPAQTLALIRSRQRARIKFAEAKMVNIGGCPVIAPQTNSAAPRGSDSIKLGLAFAAIYLVWGSTYLAIRYAVETIPPLVTAGIRHSIAGRVLLAWAYARGFGRGANIGSPGYRGRVLLSGEDMDHCTGPSSTSRLASRRC